MPIAHPSNALPEFVGAPLGHWWTIAHHLRRTRQTALLGATEPFEVTIADPVTASVMLSGTLHRGRSDEAHPHHALVVLIHGLGGSAESGYMFEATGTALALGFDVLRVSLRGADARGSDFYHAGLYTDVLAVLQHDTVRRYRHVCVLGISLGGHVVLRSVESGHMPHNVRAVATLCAPLDLAACSAAFDKKRQWVYRRHVLDGLKHMYVRFSAHHEPARRQLGLPSVNTATAITTIGEWDRTVVAPRHGFASAAEYYATQSAGPRLGDVRIPSLILTTRWDPMVPYHTTYHHLFAAPSLRAPSPSPAAPTPSLPGGEARDPTAEWVSKAEDQAPWVVRHLTPHVCHVELSVGGHIAFPQRGDTSVFQQTLTWLQQHTS